MKAKLSVSILPVVFGVILSNFARADSIVNYTFQWVTPIILLDAPYPPIRFEPELIAQIAESALRQGKTLQGEVSGYFPDPTATQGVAIGPGDASSLVLCSDVTPEEWYFFSSPPCSISTYFWLFPVSASYSITPEGNLLVGSFSFFGNETDVRASSDSSGLWTIDGFAADYYSDSSCGNEGAYSSGPCDGTGYFISRSVATPENGSLGLFAVGLGALAAMELRRRRIRAITGKE